MLFIVVDNFHFSIFDLIGLFPWPPDAVVAAVVVAALLQLEAASACGLSSGGTSFGHRLADMLHAALQVFAGSFNRGLYRCFQGTFLTASILPGTSLATASGILSLYSFKAFSRGRQRYRLHCVLHLFFPFFILIGMQFGIADHPLDFFFLQPDWASMRIFCSFPLERSLAETCRDTIGIDVEGDFNLRHATWGRGNIGEVKAANFFVVIGHFPFPLQNADGDRRLVVGGGGENLLFLSWNGGVAFDERSQNPSKVSIPKVSGVTSSNKTSLTTPVKHAALNCGANGHDFVWVNSFMPLFAEDLISPSLGQQACGSFHPLK